jgi:hypothetical protein
VADPFVVRRDHEWYMFFEVMNWRTNKGEIGLATSGNGWRWQYEGRILIEPFHLSYPYVFEHAGKQYMIPEARQGGGVRLYQATHFPTEWCAVAVLLEGELVDSSVFQSGGRWWMFSGDAANGRNDTLRLFSAESLTGRWEEHPSSPVVSGDARNARPAGRILCESGKIIRFAQNCDGRYGNDVRAFEVTELTVSGYADHPLQPSPILRAARTGWASGGMHHVDACLLTNNVWWAAVDGCTRAKDSADGTERRPDSDA